MTTFYNRELQRARAQSQRAQHFAPPERRKPFDWLTWSLLAAACVVMAGLFLLVSAQRARFEQALEIESRSSTVHAVNMADRLGYERAVAEITPVVEAAFRAGRYEGMLASCGRTY